MRLLYEANDSIEAHMVLNLIESEGLVGRIDGDHLTGGVGELQAIGVVRVMVEEADFERGKTLVDAFDEKQPKSDQSYIVTRTSVASLIFSFILGAATAVIYFTILKPRGIL